MLVSVTPLGSRQGDAGRAAIQVVNYVEGKVQAAERLARDPAGEARGYYADSVEGPGWWLGGGTDWLGLNGQVVPDHLERVLRGEHPGTGERLRPATRAAQASAASGRTSPRAQLTIEEAARIVGVNDRYLRRIAARTERELAQRVGEMLTGAPLSPTSKTFLIATRSEPDGAWIVEPEELERFMASRRPAKSVIGYDVTFNAPKSVSILWAVASPEEQREIVAAVESAVDAGLAYLESVTSTRSLTRPELRGLVAAAFLHGTSRNLDPHLHVHSIVANLAQRIDGEVRALDGRDLFAHAKTAGYLAAAQLRHECARRLGWRWGPVVHGLADVDGVPMEAIRAMSSRHSEVESLAAEIGVHSATGRQVAAYQTRPAKRAVAPSELRTEWDKHLTDAGFDPAARAACFGRDVEPPSLGDRDRARLLAHLASARGVTERAATFDRRDVIQVAAGWANAALSAREILDVADEFLASEQAIPLAPSANGDVIRLRGGRVAPSARGVIRYSTPAMLAAESQVLDAFAAGLDRGLGIVPSDLIEAAVAQRPSLGFDQAAMVRSICSSGDQFQCVLGPAGSGKTFALDAARDAWERAGFRVIGAADQGTAAEVLGRGTGVRAETLEYWLTVLDTQTQRVLDHRTVLLLDEASTAGTRSLARLFAHAQSAGAIVRLVGDPAQHSAVTAGGGFRDLIDLYRERTPELTDLRRQSGPELGNLRLALQEYREGLIAEAMGRLHADDRVVLADTAEALLDQLAADWWVDREARRAQPGRASSSMVAEHHRERRALNARARVMLATAGELCGPALEVASHEFRAGDEVICRAPAKHLHPPGQPRRYLRNGTRGVVVAVHLDGPRSDIAVDFEHRGSIRVPLDFLAKELRPGVIGGLTYSYALTSHAAQGHTHDAARTLATDSSSRAGIYVGLTRGRHDSRLYAVRRRDLRHDPDAQDHMPRLDDDKTTLEAVTDRLITSGSEHLATTSDPAADAVPSVRDAHSLADLLQLHETARADGERQLLARAIRAKWDAVTRASCLQPPPELDARIGPRPPAGAAELTWKAAIAAAAVHGMIRDVDPAVARRFGLPDAPLVEVRLRDAEIAFLAQQPTRDLASEASDLSSELTSVSRGSLRHRRRLAAALTRADDAVARAKQAVAAAQSAAPAHPGVARSGRGHSALASADVDLARAKRHRDLLAIRTAMLDEDPAAHDGVARRLDALQAALDRQVRLATERAKATPPPYVLQLLGSRPPGDLGREWDRAVRQVERYRHGHGLSPDDLVTGCDLSPQEQALGPCPRSPAAAVAWRATLDSVMAISPVQDLAG